MKLYWLGKVEQDKTIRVTPNANLQVGKTQQMKAEVRTTGYQAADWTDVTKASSTTTWALGDAQSQNVVSVDAKTGLVTAKKEGTATVIAMWNKDKFFLREEATITSY